jgi:hypothetical protein
MHAASRLFLAISLVAVLGCDSAGSDTNVAGVCDALVKCGMAQKDCAKAFGLVVLSQDCVDAMNQATCAEHAAATPPYTQTCFPACDGADDSCDGNLISSCVNGKTLAVECGDLCKSESMTYTGTCGPTYKGQDSESGKPVCWCL